MKKLTLILTAIIFTGTISAQIIAPVPIDKQYHLGAGAFFGVWGTLAGNSLDLSAEESALLGVASAAVAGIGKECMDVAPVVFGNKSARFDVMDIAATVEGGIIGAGLSYVALKLFKKPPVIYGSTNKGLQIGVSFQF